MYTSRELLLSMATMCSIKGARGFSGVPVNRDSLLIKPVSVLKNTKCTINYSSVS